MVKKKTKSPKEKKVGQITVKSIGEKYSVCVSGNPVELFTAWNKAVEVANQLRVKHGRKISKSNKKRKK